MSVVVAIYLLILTLFVLWLVVSQYLRGTHDLLTLRNLALAGFVVFQLGSGVFTLLYGPRRTVFMLERPGLTSVVYAIMATIFLVVFLWSYDRGFGVRTYAARLPVTRAIPGPIMLWLLAIVFLVLTALCRLSEFAPPIPGLPQLIAIVGVAFGAMSAGIAGWIWGPRLFNPVVMVGALLIVAAATVILITGVFGRRPLVAVGAALLWGMYFSHFRYLTPRHVLPRMVVIGLVPVVLVALFTSVREAAEHDRTATEHLRAMVQRGNVGEGLMALIGGQDTARHSMWLIETYGDDEFETRPLFTVLYTMAFPVPRVLWPGKPEPLSTNLPHMATISHVDREGLTIGPGIIGHAAAEGGWVALLIYAFLGGLLIRFFDEVVMIHVHNPIIVLPLGTGLAHVIGMARGETSAFTALFLLGTVGVYITTLIFGYMLETIYAPSAMFQPEDWDDEDEQWDEYEQLDDEVHGAEGVWPG